MLDARQLQSGARGKYVTPAAALPLFNFNLINFHYFKFLFIFCERRKIKRRERSGKREYLKIPVLV